MQLRIFNNLSSLTTQRAPNANKNRFGQIIERIAFGFRVNNASGDIASFSISESLRSDVRALNQVGKNICSAISLVYIADGALMEVSSIVGTSGLELTSADISNFVGVPN